MILDNGSFDAAYFSILASAILILIEIIVLKFIQRCGYKGNLRCLKQFSKKLRSR